MEDDIADVVDQVVFGDLDPGRGSAGSLHPYFSLHGWGSLMFISKALYRRDVRSGRMLDDEGRRGRKSRRKSEILIGRNGGGGRRRKNSFGIGRRIVVGRRDPGGGGSGGSGGGGGVCGLRGSLGIAGGIRLGGCGGERSACVVQVVDVGDGVGVGAGGGGSASSSNSSLGGRNGSGSGIGIGTGSGSVSGNGGIGFSTNGAGGRCGWCSFDSIAIGQRISRGQGRGMSLELVHSIFILALVFLPWMVLW